MKKLSALLFSLTLVFSLGLAGCQSAQDKPDGGTEPGEEVISGTAAEVLVKLLENSGMDFGMTFEDPATTEDSQSLLGLDADQFDQYVSEAYVSTAAISARAHLVAVIKCKDAASAVQVKELVAGGFDSERWICVAPEQSLVVEAGSYVLLAATTKEAAEAVKTAFSDLADGTAGEAEIFYAGRA